MSLEIGQIVYNLTNIEMFMRRGINSDKTLIENISNNKIIAINENQTKYAIKTFNGRLENWYDVETGKSNAWDSNVYTTDINKVLETYEHYLESFKNEQALKDLEEIKNLEQKILKIKNKELPEHKFIEKQEKYFNNLVDKFQEKELGFDR